MSTISNNIRENLSANGKAAKALVILYIIWLYVILTVIVNTYGTANHHNVSSKVGWIIMGMSILGSIVPALISTLHEGIYGVQFYGFSKKRRQEYLKKLDERQLHVRREIFEKSYAILATLTLFSVFVGSSWFNGLSANGTFSFGYNILMLVIGMPSLVAVWGNSANTHADN